MRPLRSLAIGDTDGYFSPYLHGVALASARLGIWHSQISIRSPIAAIRQRVLDMKPDLIWTHMLLWAPPDAPKREELLALCAGARKMGARVIVHDGDYKEKCRHPHDLRDFVDVALCNHRHDRSPWKVPILFWPYACFPQDRIADSTPEFECDLFFAGQLGQDATYGGRTSFVRALKKHLGDRMRLVDPMRDGNTLMRTAEVAASALCVLGMSRPETPGWIDTRCFQYPGAGAILLYDASLDDVGLWQNAHYLCYEHRDVDSVIARLEYARSCEYELRGGAIVHGQAEHSYVARVRQVLAHFGLST